MSRAPAHDPPPDAGNAASESNKRFWYVAVPVLMAAVVIVVGSLLNRPDTGYREGGPEPRQNLRQARRAAEIIRAERGSYADATPDELAVIELTLAFVPADRASTEPRVISVLAQDHHWIGTASGGADGCYVLAVGEEGPAIEDVIDPGGPEAGCAADALAPRLADLP